MRLITRRSQSTLISAIIILAYTCPARPGAAQSFARNVPAAPAAGLSALPAPGLAASVIPAPLITAPTPALLSASANARDAGVSLQFQSFPSPSPRSELLAKRHAAEKELRRMAEHLITANRIVFPRFSASRLVTRVFQGNTLNSSGGVCFDEKLKTKQYLCFRDDYLLLLNNDDELAFTVAHELAHIVLDHIHEEELLPRDSASHNSAVRGMESAADEMGMRYALNAGYDPRRIAGVFKQGEQGGSSYDRHPATSERLRKMMSLGQNLQLAAAARPLSVLDSLQSALR